jgi:predicted XRE-type DNA-binding protein
MESREPLGRDMTTVAIAAEIRAEIGRRNMSRAQLAREMGVSQMWMSDRMNGKVAINLYELQLFATALELHVTDLLPRWMLLSGPVPRWADLRDRWPAVTHGGGVTDRPNGTTLRQHVTPPAAPSRPPNRPAGHTSGPGRTARTRGPLAVAR